MAPPRMPRRPEKASRTAGLALLWLAAAGLSGCSVPDAANPIEWYRDATGASKDDAVGQGARNTQNLEAGGQAPYPNLATVPPPPERALTTVEREKLQKGLLADRTNARYSDEELRQGRSVPPIPGEPPPAAQTGPDNAPGSTPAVAPGTPRAGPATRGSAQPAQESTLTSPEVRSLPQGDRPHPAPPAPAAPPAQRQAAVEASPPLPPRTAPLPPASQPAVMASPRGKGSAVSLAAAEIAFAGDSKALSADDRQRLAEVAKLQKEGGGSLRVIGYGRRGFGTDAAQQELQSFGDALDRASAVAQALGKLGVPANRITVQAAPELVDGGLSAGKAEVLLEY